MSVLANTPRMDRRLLFNNVRLLKLRHWISLRAASIMPEISRRESVMTLQEFNIPFIPQS
jgi:hypothetical protein